MTPEDRAAYRAFVRDHHPDRGGDPEAFAAGLAGFRQPPEPAPPAAPERELTAGDLPLPARILIAALRTVRRTRAERHTSEENREP